MIFMREEYDFSNAVKNLYTSKLKKQISLNINTETIEYFKEEAAVTGIPYQNLISLYLIDCAKNKRHLNMSWI